MERHLINMLLIGFPLQLQNLECLEGVHHILPLKVIKHSGGIIVGIDVAMETSHLWTAQLICLISGYICFHLIPVGESAS